MCTNCCQALPHCSVRAGMQLPSSQSFSGLIFFVPLQTIAGHFLGHLKMWGKQKHDEKLIYLRVLCFFSEELYPACFNSSQTSVAT